MYHQLAAVSAERHRNRRFRRSTDAFFAQNETTLEVVTEEVPHVLAALPLCFCLEGRQPILKALLSVVPERNLLVSPGGAWVGPYKPASVRLYPFAVAIPEGSPDAMLCIDESALTEDEQGVLLFDADGNKSEELERVQRVMTNYHQGRLATRRAVARLHEAGLIAPWLLKLQQGEEIVSVQGISHIDEEALKHLPEGKLAELCATGALGLAYAQLLSEARLENLQKAATAHANADMKKQELEAQMKEMLGDEDTLKFDF